MMDAFLKREILGVVEIPSHTSLEGMAVKLGSLINGLHFEKEETGRFDEVPAFLARDGNSGATFVLFGIPEGESGDAYTLEFSAETDLTIQEFGKTAPGFVNNFLAEKAVNSRGYFDYSDELAKALRMGGIEASKSAP